jgi:hypothetical protein
MLPLALMYFQGISNVASQLGIEPGLSGREIYEDSLRFFL